MDSPSILARFTPITVRPSLFVRRSRFSVVEEHEPLQPVKIDGPRPLHISDVRLKKKRKHKSSISVYEDLAPKKVCSVPADKYRGDGRVALSDRVDSANSTPTPSPRAQDTPRSLTPVIFCFDDKENIDPAPVTTPVPYVSTVTPMPPAGPPPPLPPGHAVTRHAFTIGRSPLTQPRNMVLYDVLGITDWTATRLEIVSAWRQAAFHLHPDRRDEENRLVATLEMQKLNAAKDVLTDMRRRLRYHRTGELPLDI